MDNMENMMMAAILAQMIKEDKVEKITPFQMQIDLTPVSISYGTTLHKAIFKDLGEEGAAWAEETQRLLSPIMAIQTKKFADLITKKIGGNYSEVVNLSDDDFAKDMRRDIFG